MESNFHITRVAALAVPYALGCSEQWEGPREFRDVLDGAAPSAIATTQQSVVTPGGLANQRPEVGNIPGCTATLIHSNFAIAAQHCRPFPVVAAGEFMRFTDTAGALIVPDSTFTGYWQRHPTPNLTGHTGSSAAVLNNDIVLMRLAAPPVGVNPTALATLLPPDGTTVSTVGYGKFGAGCSSSDGLKRWQNYSWGAPPYPTCPGDSGGPHFNAAFPNGLPFAVTGNSGGNGSLVHYRERLFNEMRQLNDFATGAVTSWLPNTLRGGTVHSNAAAATPSDCANLCAANTNCKGWNLLGATCNMLSVVSSWVPTAVSTSGLPTPWQKDSSRGGTVLQNTTAISKSHCASKCGADTNCAGYTHTDSTGACQLYTTTLTAPVTSVGKWSGARRTAHVGVDMPGGDILPPTTTSNAAACGVECAKHAECQSYAWVISTNQCFKKYATPGTTANGNVVSDWKRPVRLPGILFAGTTIGADFEPSPLLDEGCRKACASNGSCVAYSVKLPDYGEAIKCRLFSSVTQELPALTWYDSNYMGLTYF